jgi:hypothetical protein
MPLFFGKRDMQLFHHLSREVVDEIIEVTIILYKISADSPTNLYGESLDKFYEVGVKIPALIEHDEQVTDTDEFGPSINQKVRFRMQRTTLETKKIYPQNGDIVQYHDAYFEIEQVVENQLPGGQTYNLFSIVCDSHMISRDKVNFDKLRVGE